MSAPGFAVLDFETTGFFPLLDDRVVELAVVHLDREGAVEGRWDTLIEPYRDLGLDTHGITADDLVGAPTFAHVAPRLIELLDGRIVVAHNAAFHLPFLNAELVRAGYAGEPIRALCTMQLAREFLPGAGRTLQDALDAYDLELADEHRASTEASGTASLVAAYLDQNPYSPSWNAVAPASLTPIDGDDVEWMPRRPTPGRAASFLQRITIKLPEFSGPAEQLDYLALLDRCLIDRQLTTHEASALVDLAENLGISRTTCEELHHQYFEELSAIAWADGHLSEEEVHDLVAVGQLLSIPAGMVERSMEPFALAPVTPLAPTAGSFTLAPGDIVVFTGELSRPISAWRTRLVGRDYVVSDAVTRNTKILVAADPELVSGKVSKALDYGVPIIAESALDGLL